MPMATLNKQCSVAIGMFMDKASEKVFALSDFGIGHGVTFE